MVPSRDSDGDGPFVSEEPLSKAWMALALAAFSAVALLIYAPALQGGFIADDRHYIQINPYVHEISWDKTVTLWDPTGPLPLLVENYAPVHILLHASSGSSSATPPPDTTSSTRRCTPARAPYSW